jgi:DNA-binding NarL/FixJ family response regulator
LRGLGDLVAREACFDVVAKETGGMAAVEAIRSLKPDIAIVDLNMPEVSGMDVLNLVMRELPTVRLVFLTASITDSQVLEAIAKGIWGIVLKEVAPEALILCLRQVAQGRRWLPNEMVERAIAYQTEANTQQMQSELLTDREFEIALLVAEGLSNKVIARRLSLSIGTVKIHLHNIYRKIQVENRTALAALAFEWRQR